MIKVNGKERPWKKGITVADLLKEIGATDDSYDLVIINGQHVLQSDYEKTVIFNNAEVRLIPMIAGG
jgi:thiamine biosynthesis protein ThiS